MVTYVDTATWEWGPSVVCLGYFDGVHIGHQALIRLTETLAQELSLVSCVHSYDVPPISLLKPDIPCQVLTSFQEKCDLLQRYGAGIVAISHFNDRLQHMPGERFFREVLMERMQAKHLVVGFDHRFGFRGDTDVTRLQQLCDQHGLGLSVVPAVRTTGGQTVSSSSIRAALREGNYALAQEMLGRPLTDSQLSCGCRQQLS